MEDLKETFAQMMRFQMEFQQKNERLFQLLQGNNEKEQENDEKQQRFFLELQKQQEALFKSRSNNQPTDSTVVFTQNAVWNAVETFIYQMKIRPSRHITEDMKISILPTVPIGLMLKCSPTSTKARKCRTQQVHRLYLTKKKNLRIWLFRNS